MNAITLFLSETLTAGSDVSSSPLFYTAILRKLDATSEIFLFTPDTVPIFSRTPASLASKT